MEKSVSSKAIDDLIGEAEREDAKELFSPQPSINITVNVGGGHKEPDGDEGVK